ncbi:MAG: FtsX-like permease family protein [Bacteroidota bacterium]
MPYPPKHAVKFLRWFCREDYIEEIEGDLFEQFESRHRYSLLKAKGRFYLEVLMHFRLDFIKPLQPITYPIRSAMLKNYLRVTVRNQIRQPIFSAIKILGLSLGISCFLFILMWVQDEYRVDKFHENEENLYNVYLSGKAEGEPFGNYSTFHRWVDTNQMEIPIREVTHSIPEVQYLNFYATGYELPWGSPETFQVGDIIHNLEGSRATEDFFNMFSCPIIAGDKENPLQGYSSIAISRKMAELFFENPKDAVGKSIRYEDYLDLIVTAVFEDLPSYSTLKFDFLINWKSHETRLDRASNHFLTTLQLRSGSNVTKVTEDINRILQPLINEEGSSLDLTVGLQPFSDRYLVSNFEKGVPNGGRIEYVRIFGGVAFFILLLACINFMNLSTANSGRRAKEIGVRKVVGSTRKLIVRQFLGEAVFLSVISLGVSLVFLYLLLPYFNALTGKQIPFGTSIPYLWLLGLVLFTGLMAGAYPAFFLASLKPVKVLAGPLRFSPSSQWLRKALTIFQFSLSSILLIATLVVSRQTHFVQASHLGYDRENLLYFRVEGEFAEKENYELFKTQATKLPGVALVDRSSEAPHTMGFEVTDPIGWEGKEIGSQVGFKPASVGFDFVQLMDLDLVEGRGFSTQFSTDSADAFLINEEAVKQMGMENPIGKWVSAWDKKGHIIGILKDYHTHSLYESIKPVIIDVKEYERFGVILVRTNPGDIQKTLAGIEKIYRAINPNYPFDFQFIDEEYQNLYKSEQVTSKLSYVFALLALVISSLGLLGLAIFSVQYRTKEMGIRRVLGATASQIMALFSKEFLQLVAISFLVSTPISWILMSRWLSKFAYRIELSWGIFALAGIIALGIAGITIGSQSLKVASISPVDSLKNE